MLEQIGKQAKDASFILDQFLLQTKKILKLRNKMVYPKH